MAATPVMHTIVFFVIVAVASAQTYANVSQYNAAKLAEAEAAAAKKAKEAKMAAVNKVVTMLKDLSAKVTQEGMAEATTYDKFACFCKDTQAKKAVEINEGISAESTLTADIALLASKRTDEDSAIGTLTGEIGDLENDMKVATKTHKEAVAKHAAEMQDLSQALTALKYGIQTLKVSAPSGYSAASLVQVQSNLKAVRQTVERALILADALGLSTNSTGVASFLQEAPEVQMENYKFQSDGVIVTLEKLQADFTATKNDLERQEVSRIQDYDILSQGKTNTIATKNNMLADAKAKKDKIQTKIEAKSRERSTAIAELNNDREYQAKLYLECANKKTTYDQRKEARLSEISMITEVVGILSSTVSEKTTASTYRLLQRSVNAPVANIHLANAVAENEDAMDYIEASVEEQDDAQAPAGFLQRRQIRHKNVVHHDAPMNDAREALSELFQRTGTQLQSSMLLTLASRMSTGDDPFGKVKTMIQNLIEKLQREAADEAGSKGACDQMKQDAETKRTNAVKEVADLNADMGEYESAIAKLTDEIAKITIEEQELNDALDKATQLRGEERVENAAVKAEANAGQVAIKQAKDIFFQKYGVMKKNTVDNLAAASWKNYTLIQQSPSLDAPDAGFDIGEAYMGSQDSASGIIGMMDVISSDFSRTVSKADKDEKMQEKAFQKLKRETAVSLTQKEMERTNKVTFKSDYTGDLEAAAQKLTTEMGALTSSITTLINHKATCVDTGMSYEDRVAKREKEIEALRQALCLLNAKNGMEYDPNEMC